MAYMEVLNGPEVGKKVSLAQDTFFIGRDGNNHLVLSDRTVSRKHAVINQVEGHFIISDLKSLKGLLVNGSKVSEATLEDGDEIALGAVRVGFFTGKESKTTSGFGKSKSKNWRSMGLTLLVLLIIVGAGVGYYFRSSLNFDFVKTLHNLEAIQSHYEEAVDLFNTQRDAERAKQEWQKVLELDPDQKTPFGQKAAKLLEIVD